MRQRGDDARGDRDDHPRPTPPHDRMLAFGPFRFSTVRQQLWHDDRPVRLGSRAGSLLAALVGRPGDLIGKDDLMAVAWPSTYVEEGNLRVHIAALRKALGDVSGTPSYIVNVPGRGYRFVAPVQMLDELADRPPPWPAPPVRSTLPPQPAQVFGREHDLARLGEMLADARLVTIAGPGGIGKTTAALALAHQLQHRFPGAASFVDLAAVSEPAIVPFAVASATRIAIDTQRPVESLVSGLLGDRALLVFDNCEHVIDTVALVAESLLKSAPGITILATSHEPLRAEGERVFRLAAFDLPAGAEDLTLNEALHLPAVRLFAQQMRANDDTAILGDLDVPFIVEICRRLDGLPLAIEIAAARAGALGTAELAQRLDDRLGLLTTGRRTVALRHQTLRSMLDWSFETLSERERIILRRLAVFSGAFTLASAGMIAASEDLSPSTVTEGVAGLVRKSLLMPLDVGGVAHFRLLESTRIYAAEKLADAGETLRVRQLHLHQLCDVLRRAESDWPEMPVPEWTQTYSRYMDDIRAALTWAFGPDGSDEGGVVLTSLTLPLAMLLGLHDEFRDRMRTAVERAEGLVPRLLLPELRLHVAANSLGYNVGQRVDGALSRAVELAEMTGADRHRLEPMVQLSSADVSLGAYATALERGELALQYAEASGDGMARLSASRALAQAAHYAGQHERSMAVAREVLRHPARNIPYTYGFMHSDRRITMRWVLVRALWMTGRGDEAAVVADEGIAIAEDAGVVSTALFLAMAAIPMFLWRGDDDAARRLTQRLSDHSQRFSFKYWQGWARLFAGVLEHRRGGDAAAPGLDVLQQQSLSTFSGLAVPLARVAGAADWSAPELTRLRGERLLAAGEAVAAEADLLGATNLARAHGAVAWELRAATSLARLHRAGPRRAEAAHRLAAVLDRLPRSDAEADQRAALQLLSEMR